MSKNVKKNEFLEKNDLKNNEERHSPDGKNVEKRLVGLSLAKMENEEEIIEKA